MKIYSMDEYNRQDKKIYSMDDYLKENPVKDPLKEKKEKNKIGKTLLTGVNYLGQGVIKGAEGIGDTLLHLGSSKINPYYWFNPDKLEEHQNIVKDIIKTDATKNMVDTFSGVENFNQEVLDKNSLIKENNLGGAVLKSVGQMLPSIAIGSGLGAGTKAAENVGLGVMGAQSFGGGLEEAYNKGATRGQATSYALMNSAIETATEKRFAGIGGVLGKGALDDAIKTKLTKKMSNAVAKKLTEYGLDMVGEGVEELASDLLQPLAQKLSGISKENLGKLYKDQNYLEDFVAGALSAGLMQGVRLPSDIKTAMQENSVKKAAQEKVKLPGTRTEQSISNNIEELRQEQRETTDNKIKQELATKISGLEQEYKNNETASAKYKVSRQMLEKEFTKLTGDSKLQADAKMGRYAFQQIQKQNGNFDGEVEAPYSEEAMKLYKQIENSKKTSSHLYHSTPIDRIQSIIKNGLQVGSKQNQEGVSSANKLYLSATEELANSFTPEESVMLRISPSANLENLDYDLLGGEGSYTITNNIEPKYLQVKENGKWVNLLKSKYTNETKTKLKDIEQPKKEVKLPKAETKKITEELANLYQQTKVQVQDEDVKGTPFNTLLGYGDKTALIQVKGNLKNINGVEVGIYKDSNGNWHVVDLKSNFALDRANYKSQKEAIENATNVINNFDLDKLRKNVQKRKSEAIDLTNYTQDDFINAEYDENGIGYPIKEEKPNLPKSKSLPMVKEEPVLKANASEIANEMNSVNGKRGWIGTAAQSDVLKDTTLIKDLDTSKLNYVVESNQKSVDTANNHLDTYGYEKSLEDVKSMLRSDKLPKASDVALAERLLQEAIKNGDTKTAQNLIMDIAILGTDLGQATQALSMINRLTPEGQLKMYTKIIERAKTRGEKAFKDVEITTDMVQNVLDAYNEDGTYDQNDLNNRVEQFKQQIANQMKTTIGEKINAWRYLSMLGNPKTHIRNIVSNVAMNGTIKVKNAMARTLESVLPIENRTKTWKKASTEIQNYANKTAEEMKGIITGENKYNEKTALETKKQVFKNKTLEKLSDFNSNALEAEDWFFSKKAFKSTLQEYLTANGINTLEDIKNNPEVVEKAKIYAVEQAEIATFRQYSKLASAINSLEKNNKAARLFIEATMPFKKTPINVAKAGVKYSPLGLIKAISYDIYQVKQGNMEASQFIDNLSQGLTGTSLAMLGYALAKAGILNGSGNDDKEGKYDSQLGENQYSLKIGDKSYSISWLSPVAMPLLVGANAYEQLEEKEEWDMNVVSDTLAKTLDPLNEMSFMQGLTNALTSYGSGVDKIKGSLESVGQNYVGQFFPTLFSQFASTIDDKKRSTKASANSTYKFGEQTLRSVMYKLPGLRQQLEVATDIWGNEKEQADNIIQRAYESFLAPYSTTKNITTNLDKEIKRVYNETGENKVIPGIPYAYVKYGDETYRMSANEYTKYKKTYGTTANSTLNSLIGSQEYKTASNEDKAKMIDNVYDYARAKANKEYFDSINVAYENKTLDKINTLKSEFGINANTYYANKNEYDYAYQNPDKYKTIKQITSYDKYTQYKNKITEIKDNTTNDKQETIKYINSLNLSIPQKAMLIKQYYKSFTQYDSEIIKYINSQNLSKEDKQTILGQLGFVIRDGRVYSK